MSQGEIIESLRSRKTSVPISSTNFYQNDPEIEIIDKFLYYLRCMKANLNKEGDRAYLQRKGTKSEFISYRYNEPIRLSQFNKYNHPGNTFEDAGNYLAEQTGNTIIKGANFLLDLLPENSFTLGHNHSHNYTDPERVWGADDILDLNKIHSTYEEGFYEIVKLIKDITKNNKDVLEDEFQSLNTTDLNTPLTGQNQWSWRHGYVGKWDINHTGTYPLFKGMFAKRISQHQVADDVMDDNGKRKNFYVRWDMLCQI